MSRLGPGADRAVCEALSRACERLVSAPPPPDGIRTQPGFEHAQKHTSEEARGSRDCPPSKCQRKREVRIFLPGLNTDSPITRGGLGGGSESHHSHHARKQH